MTYVSVWSCSYDFLLTGDFDRSRSESIFLEYQKYDEEPEHDQNISYCDYVRRHRGPSEAMIDSGDNEDRDKCDHREELYDVLPLLLLGAWAGIYPPLKELRIAFNKVGGDRQHRSGKHSHENPRL